MRTLISFLSRYEVASGQKMNRSKSMFVPSKHCTIRQTRAIAFLSGFSKGSLPFIYLGNNLFRGRPRKIYFQYVLDTVSKGLYGWCGKLLSSGGKLYSSSMFSRPFQCTSFLYISLSKQLFITSSPRSPNSFGELRRL